MPTLTDTLRAFVTDNFLFGQSDGFLTDDTSFLESGIIDSTGMLELIGFVERTFRIRLDDDELIPDNLDSIAKLAIFISRRQAGGVREPGSDNRSVPVSDTEHAEVDV